MKGLLLLDVEGAFLPGAIEGAGHCRSRDLAFDYVMNRLAAAVRPVQLHPYGVRLRVERAFRQLERRAIWIHRAMQRRAIPFQLDRDLGLTGRRWAPFAHPGSGYRVGRGCGRGWRGTPGKNDQGGNQTDCENVCVLHADILTLAL